MLTRDPPVLWRLLSRESSRIPTNLIFQKPETMSPCRKFAPLTVGLCISSLVFTQLFSKATRSNRRENRIKREIAIKGHSRSRILEFLKSRRRTAHRRIITWPHLYSFRRNSQRNRWKLPFSTTTMSFDGFFIVRVWSWHCKKPFVYLYRNSGNSSDSK